MYGAAKRITSGWTGYNGGTDMNSDQDFIVINIIKTKSNNRRVIINNFKFVYECTMDVPKVCLFIKDYFLKSYYVF